MAKNPDRGRNVAIGCLMLPLGAMSGGMTGVLVSKIVAWVTKAPSCSGIPTCDWYIYAGWGGLVGALTLPALVSWRLLQSAPSPTQTSDTNRS
ncbi:MAG: hypothetical protein ACXWZ7_05150 [Gemmatirosa sp.]